MPLVNRDKDSSEQRFEWPAVWGGASFFIGTGQTLVMAPLPCAGSLDGVRAIAVGISGAPTIALNIQRFIVGTGATAITGGMTTLTVPEFGTSGLASGSLASAGSTLLSLQAGDVISFTTAGSNAGAKSIAVSLVIKATQDIKSHFGIA